MSIILLALLIIVQVLTLSHLQRKYVTARSLRILLIVTILVITINLTTSTFCILHFENQYYDYATMLDRPLTPRLLMHTLLIILTPPTYLKYIAMPQLRDTIQKLNSIRSKERRN